MRLPPQGGLPPVDRVTGDVVKIASDESGFSGTNLLTGHPGVHARECRPVHRRGGRAHPGAAVRVPVLANEFKSGQFLRGPLAGEALEWLLAALRGRAHVHLVDKEYFLITRIVDLFLAEPSYAAGTRLTQDQRPAALTLYRAGRSGWSRLECLPRAPSSSWFAPKAASAGSHGRGTLFQARDSLLRDRLGAQAKDVLDGLSRTRVQAVLTRLATATGRSRHRWSRCCPRWPRPSCSGAAAGRTTDQGRHRLRRLMRGAPTEVPVIDQERRGQAQQRLRRQERHLPAMGRTTQGQRPELLPRLADRQVQVISQVSHVRRLQPARPHKEPLSRAATSAPSVGAPHARHDRQCLPKTSGRRSDVGDLARSAARE